VFEAFREEDYRRFWVTQFISNIGSWMQMVAQGWLVYRLTDSAFLLGFVAFSSSIPSFFLMLPSGVLADQLDRKTVLRLSQWGQAFGALFLAVMIYAGRIAVWHIIAASIVVGICTAISAPVYQAMVVDLLDDRANLANAVMMNSLQFQLSRLVGPVIGGLALARFGGFWCFFLNALSFLPLIWFLKRLRQRQTRVVDSTPLLERLAEGFRYVRGDGVVLLLLSIVAAVTLFGYPLVTLMPLLARVLYRNDAEGLGYLMGYMGLGALVGSLFLSMRTPGEQRSIRIIGITLFTFAGFLAAVPFAHQQSQIAALLIFCGGSMVTGVALCNTVIQRRVPDAMRGRVLSMYTFAFSSFLPVGNLLSGLVAEHRGLSFTLVAMAIGILVSGLGLAAAVWLRPRAPVVAAVEA
jgi:MFS family permease